MKLRKLILAILLIVSGIVFISCNSEPKKKQIPQTLPEVSIDTAVVHKGAKSYRVQLNYKLDTIGTREYLDSILKPFSEQEQELIYALNRIDNYKIRASSVLVIPECASKNFNAYSPFPKEIVDLQCLPKAVLISKRIQAFGIYENGNLVKWGPASTGKQSTKTPNGLNYGNYKAKRKVSSIDESWILPYYFNFMNYQGIGVHKYVLPGHPASHGCVRLFLKDAKYIYDWANMWEVSNQTVQKNGTPFMVFGEYNYKLDKPWLKLAEDMKANDLSKAERDTIRAYVFKYQNDSLNFPIEKVNLERTFSSI